MPKKVESPPSTPNGTFAGRHSLKDQSAYSLTTEAFTRATIPLIDKLEAFPRFSTKRSLARFLVKHEIFKKIMSTTGVIIECGVFNGDWL